MKKAVIIGSGIGGIATAIRLTQKGYRVTVLEKNNQVGGKITEIRQHGFRFDMGPSLFTLPELVEELFVLCKEKTEDYFAYQPLAVICKYFYPDNTIVNAYSHRDKFVAELNEKLGENPKDIKRFLEKAEKIYHITKPVFLEKSLHKFSTYLNTTTLKSLWRIHEIDVFSTMHNSLKTYFTNPKTIQFFDRYATYNGSNPYQAPATLNVISHLEHHHGAYFPLKGMYSIVEALRELAQKKGVDFQTNTSAEQIIVEKNKAIGVTTVQKFLQADVIVSNADITTTYRRLLNGQPAPEFVLKQPRSSSALIFYWGINRIFPELDVHNILFSQNYKQEFDAIFHHSTIADDVTVYIFISSKVVTTDAPKGCENWFVMINVPPDSGQDWNTLISTAKKNIIKRINDALKVEITSHIVTETILDPRGIEHRTSSAGGALYGSSSNNPFAAFLRHPNFSNRISNLYFCGGSVHPGGGIPLCLLSAKITDALIEKASERLVNLLF